MSRLIAIAGLAMLAAAPALGQARQDVREASQRCDGAGITDDRLWLDCYYGAAQAMRSHLNLPPAPASQQRMVPQATSVTQAPAPRARAAAVASGPAPLPQRSRGWLGALTGGGKLVRANQRIASWSSGGIVLMTGERWELVSGNANPTWSGNPVVNIREGALGSYNMKVTGDRELYKVRPVNTR